MPPFWHALPKPFFALAPLAGVTDPAFRRLIAKYGKPHAMWTEFTSADGLCAAGRERLLASPVELEREGPSFTIDTLDGLAAGRGRPDGGAAVLFVVGSDAFQEIRTWSRYEQLLDRHPVLVHRRAGCAIAEAVTVLPRRFRARVTADLSAPLIPPRILTLDIDLPDPKSYRIRELLKQHTPVDHLVPPRVAARIAERGLYR